MPFDATHPNTAIIGGGFAGIAAAVKLKKAGLRDFTIFEKSPSLGGTWYENRYPGAEVDVSSHLYSYSFRRQAWTRTHARQAELLKYLEDVVDEHDLRRHFRFDTRIEAVNWDDAAAGWVLRDADGEQATFRAVISAVGFLNIPSYPSWPGLEDFSGTKLHTAAWKPVDLAGKRVAVVGTGSSAVQVIATIAPEVEHLSVFQREPGWVLPKLDRDFTDEEISAFALRRNDRKERMRLWWQAEKGQMFGAMNRPSSKLAKVREEQCRQYIGHMFADRPDLAEKVTPGYAYGGKRLVLSKDYYPTLLRDNVELVPRAVQSVTTTGVVDAEGTEHPIDVLVMATGFKPADFLASIRVTGPSGRTLQDIWNGEPQAFAGVTVPGFPNFYMLYGPNTNGGEIVSNLERQSEFAARSIKRLRDPRVSTVEVRPSFYRVYNAWLQRAMRNTAWVQANNYYKSPSGRVVTQGPYGVIMYTAILKGLGRVSEKVSRSNAPRGTGAGDAGRRASEGSRERSDA